MKINSISSNDQKFPERLRNISHPVKKLYYTGTLAQYTIGVAIVGTRKPTSYGKSVTSELATRLAEQGAVVVSGLAHGVDGIAHEAVVKVGGTAIAVLPAGLDKVYPSTHASLANSIIESGGALVSEYDPGTPPLQFRFLERNRIVSALSDIVIVTEASARSGTMNTVSHALEQGKDVYQFLGR